MRCTLLYTTILATVFALVGCVGHSQNKANGKKELPPYTVQTTFEKYQKKYPFISPVQITDTAGLTIKKNIIYHSTSTSRLCFDVYFADVTNPKSLLPVVLLIHGGGWIVGSKENQAAMAVQLAQHGYVAIPVSYRLSKEATYPAAVIDIKHAIQYVRLHAKELHADPNRIAILGASAGAQLATLVGVTPNSTLYPTDANVTDVVQAIVNIDGIVSFTHPESEEGTIAALWLGGDKATHKPTWEEASPLTHVTKKCPPTLFVNSSQPRFHAGRDDMMALLTKFNIYHETHTLANSPHSFWLLNPWFEPTVTYVCSFLDQILKN